MKDCGFIFFELLKVVIEKNPAGHFLVITRFLVRCDGSHVQSAMKRVNAWICARRASDCDLESVIPDEKKDERVQT